MKNLTAVLNESSFNSLDASLKEFYTQNSDTKDYYLNLPSSEAEKLATDLQTKFDNKKIELDRVHKEKNDLDKKVKSFEKLGKTPEEIESNLKASSPEDFDRRLKEKSDEYENKINSFTETIEKAEGDRDRYKNQLLSNAVEAKIAQIRSRYNLNDTAEFVLRNYYKAEEVEDGTVVTKIYENGAPALVANQPKSDEQLLGGFKEGKQYLSMFNAPNGGGTGGTNRQSTGANNQSLEGLSPTEKLKVARQNS